MEAELDAPDKRHGARLSDVAGAGPRDLVPGGGDLPAGKEHGDPCGRRDPSRGRGVA